MPTSDGPTRAALLVVDVQNNVVANAWDRDEVVGRIASLVDRARSANVPVIWVRHSSEGLPVGSPGWQIVPELVPSPGEPIVEKRYGDAFEETDLAQILTAGGINRLIVCGAQTDACVRSTIHGAFVRGYDTILVTDAHTTDDYSSAGMPSPAGVIAHTNMYWTYQDAPGRTAATVLAADVDLG